MDRSIGGELLWRKSLRGSKLLAGALHARPAINPSNSMEVSSPILSRPGTAPRGHGHYGWTRTEHRSMSTPALEPGDEPISAGDHDLTCSLWIARVGALQMVTCKASLSSSAPVLSSLIPSTGVLVAKANCLVAATIVTIRFLKFK